MRQDQIDAVLQDPVSQELMASAVPARLAYVGLDGWPRAIPIGFHFDGSEFVMGTIPHSEKVRALEANPKVALTIDDGFPPNVLLVRGTASMEEVEGIPQEYLDASAKIVPDEAWDEWEAGVRGLYERMVLIRVAVDWAKVLDFQTRIPTAVEQLLK